MVSDYTFTSGITAMKAHTRAFAAISDNISNLNTAGFKHTDVVTRSSVSDISGGSIYGNFSGAHGSAFSRITTEGTPVQTGNEMDAALLGRGFFVTSTALTEGETRLTSAGQFDITVDPANTTQSYVTDVNGNYLLGWAYDANSETFSGGTDIASVAPISVNRFGDTYTAVATSTATVSANINSDTTVGESESFGIGILDGSGTSDGVNDGQTLNIVLTKTATPNVWDLSFTANDGTVTTAATQIQFDNTGQNPTIVADGSTTISVDMAWNTPASTQSVTLELAGFTQFAGPTTLNSISSDGLEEGTLSSTYFDNEGILHGNFSNGVTRPIAKVAIGDVVNAEGLSAVSGTSYELTGKSGALTLYDPQATDKAVFVAGAYEAASTNINTEFSKMITTQRAYSSAATTIRTADEMMQTATKLK